MIFIEQTFEQYILQCIYSTAALEEAQVLKTKAMRENEEKRYAKNFKYSLIRIRFPDGLYLQVGSSYVNVYPQLLTFNIHSNLITDLVLNQGTFGAHEKLSTVFDFVMGALQHESSSFSLVSPDGQKFSNEDVDQTLIALRLV